MQLPNMKCSHVKSMDSGNQLGLKTLGSIRELMWSVSKGTLHSKHWWSKSRQCITYQLVRTLAATLECRIPAEPLGLFLETSAERAGDWASKYDSRFRSSALSTATFSRTGSPIQDWLQSTDDFSIDIMSREAMCDCCCLQGIILHKPDKSGPMLIENVPWCSLGTERIILTLYLG